MESVGTGRALELRTLCEKMKSSAEEIASGVLDRWEEIARGESWQALPPGLDYDHLPALIRSLASAGLCTDYDAELCATMVRDSAAHGKRRAEEGFDDSLLYREYHLLRRALAHRLRAEHGESATVYYATMRIDALVSLANSAALYGLNWRSLEEEGRWPDVLDDLLEEWPLPGS
jgi:hypothetical protein